MEKHELLRRAEELFARSERTGRVTATGFLSPAERQQLENWSRGQRGCRLRFHGGAADCERTLGFFLPEDMDEQAPELPAYIRCLKLTARFGAPGHRDYLGAVLGMGVGREWVGDVRVEGETAYIFCLPSVERHLLGIDKVGRFTVRAEPIALEDIPPMERQVSKRRFSVQSLRLDAVLGGLFGLSRSEAARQIAAGNVSLNYEQTLKADRAVHEGDVLSLRGAGKGKITGTGGLSRKGRLFVDAEIYK